MSQHDMDISNAAGATVRADINLALKALASFNNGVSSPATPYPYQIYVDTSTLPGTDAKVYIRNGANDAWVEWGYVNKTTGRLWIKDVTGLSGLLADDQHVLDAEVLAVAEDKTKKGAISGYAPLDAASKVPTLNLGGAGADNTKYLRGDQTWVVSEPAGDWNKVEAQDFSAAALLEFATLSSSKRYKILFDGYASDNGVSILCRINNDSGAVYKGVLHQIDGDGGHEVTINPTTSITFVLPQLTNTHGMRGQAIITTLLNNTKTQYFTSEIITYMGTVDNIALQTVVACREGASTMTSIRFFPSAGTITGRAVLYEGMV